MVLTRFYGIRTVAVIATCAMVGVGSVAAQVCSSGEPAAPDYGFPLVSCTGCVEELMRHEVTEPGFRIEPAVGAVRAGGPAAGKLQAGDTLITIDGINIDSREAAVRVATSREPARFTYRRNGTVGTATVNPSIVCVGPGTGPRQIRVLDAQGWQITQRGAEAGWLGIGLRADSAMTGGGFVVAPTVARVDPDSPASRAGLVPGLVLYSVDGLSLRSPQGAARLSGIRPGDRALLSMHGDHGWFEVAITAESREREMTVQINRLLKTFTFTRDSMVAGRATLRGRVAGVAVVPNQGKSLWYVGGATVAMSGSGMTVVRDTVGGAITIYVAGDTIVVRSNGPGGRAMPAPTKPPMKR